MTYSEAPRHLQIDNDCFKIKWRLILNRDPNTMLPTTYQLKWTNISSKDIVGNWEIQKNTGINPDIIIYKLDPEEPENSISFLAGDGNILYVLDKQQKLLIGNSDFSYTLNKKTK